MITFKEHLDYPDPFECIRHGHDNQDIHTKRDQINAALLRASRKPFLTAYIGLGRMSQVLAPYSLHVPQCVFLEGEKGSKHFDITQFGEHHGTNKEGEVGTWTKDSNTLYFEYSMNDDGMYDIFCEIVDKKGLADIQDDVEDENEGDDD